MKAARISRRPRSMPVESIHFALSGRGEKFPDGPIISPRPGPTFDMAVIAPERAVMKSSPTADSARASAIKHMA